MHGAAEPAGPDIEACLAGTLAQLQRVLRKISRDPGSAAALREVADGNVTLLEVRAAYERTTADRAIAQTCADEILALGPQIERAQSSRPAASAPRGGKARQPPLLRLVPDRKGTRLNSRQPGTSYAVVSL